MTGVQTCALPISHFREDKTSEYVNFFSTFKYDYEADELNVRYDGDTLGAVAGIQVIEGDRKASSNITSKDNKAYFASAEYRPTWLLQDLTLSAGARSKKCATNSTLARVQA